MGILNMKGCHDYGRGGEELQQDDDGEGRGCQGEGAFVRSVLVVSEGGDRGGGGGSRGGLVAGIYHNRARVRRCTRLMGDGYQRGCSQGVGVDGVVCSSELLSRSMVFGKVNRGGAAVGVEEATKAIVAVSWGGGAVPEVAGASMMTEAATTLEAVEQWR